jgi:pimeloyl-ACP methyl ester carboxylesterase
MKSLKFRNWKIAYFEAGRGEPLLFLHNGGNDHRIWEHQLGDFSRTHRVIAPDHLGYGASDKPEDVEYTLSLYTDMVAALIDQLELAPATLIGHCIGAAMSLNFARLHPDKVARLVVFNVASENTLLAGPLADVYRNLAGNRHEREALCAAVEAQPVSAEEVQNSLHMQTGDAPPADDHFAEHLRELYNRPGQRRSLYNNLSNFASFAAIDDFVRPDHFPPLLFLWGQSNRILPVTAGLQLQRRLRPDQACIIPQAGHLLMRERPSQINRLIADFIGAHPAAKPAAV